MSVQELAALLVEVLGAMLVQGKVQAWDRLPEGQWVVGLEEVSVVRLGKVSEGTWDSPSDPASVEGWALLLARELGKVSVDL